MDDSPIEKPLKNEIQPVFQDLCKKFGEAYEDSQRYYGLVDLLSTHLLEDHPKIRQLNAIFDTKFECNTLFDIRGEFRQSEAMFRLLVSNNFTANAALNIVFTGTHVAIRLQNLARVLSGFSRQESPVFLFVDAARNLRARYKFRKQQLSGFAVDKADKYLFVFTAGQSDGVLVGNKREELVRFARDPRSVPESLRPPLFTPTFDVCLRIPVAELNALLAPPPTSPAAPKDLP